MAVVSHWLLDLATQRPDLPLYPGGALLVAFGLWNSLWATLVVELLIFGFGVRLYLRTTHARDRIGSLGLWALLGFLILVYFANLFAPLLPASPTWPGWAKRSGCSSSGAIGSTATATPLLKELS